MKTKYKNKSQLKILYNKTKHGSELHNIIL